MQISFSKLPSGPYTTAMLAEQWPGVQQSRGVAEGRCRIEHVDGEHALAVTFERGKVGPVDGGVSWRYRFAEPADSYSVEYQVRVGSEFDFMRGGKLPGLCGGSSPAGGAETKEADGFSARVMWRELGVLENYLYHIDRREEKRWGSDYMWLSSCNRGVLFDEWHTLAHKQHDRVYLTPNQWHTIKNTVTMNNPGKENGRMTAWFDGAKVLDMQLRFRKDISFNVDSFRFTTFFGGDNPTWAPQKTETMYFKDICLLKH